MQKWRLPSYNLMPLLVQNLIKEMLRSGGVFDMLRSKKWHFVRAPGKQKAGRTAYYLCDGANPHTGWAKQQHSMQHHHHHMKGFKADIVTQLVQPPDLNANGLAFTFEV